jgi:hypothetical protein
MTRSPLERLRVTADERGSVLVITVVVMLTLLVFAAYAIDEGIWFVHHGHLQTEADAAAFAGADVMAEGFINGSCSNSSVKTEVARYDGSLQASTPHNQQVPVTPIYATQYDPTAHNLFDQINQKNFENQPFPNDTGLTGSPCPDAAVDVKMTETNLPSFLTFIHPEYINTQAQVRAEIVSQGGSAPFVLPNISTPNDTAVFVVAEDPATPAFSTDTILAKVGSCLDGNAAPCLTSSNQAATWTTSGLSIAFTNRPASLVVAQSSSPISSSTLSGITTGAGLAAFCTGAVSCYDQADGMGLTYTRAYTASSPNFPTAAPVIEDTAVTDSPTDPTSSCNSSGSTGFFTGFVASAGGSTGTCLVNFSANIAFGSSQTCAALGTGGNNLAATLTITASWAGGGSANSTLTCPNPTGLATGNWTSSSTLSISVNKGPVTFDLTWKRTGGVVPPESWEQQSQSASTCGNGSHTCTHDFKIVQRAFTGAYDQSTASESHSGPVAGAALTGGTGELMSTPANQTVSGLGVTIDFQGLYDTPAAANSHVPSGPFTDIAYGTQQGNGLADCGQGVSNEKASNGFDVQENAIAGLFTCINYPVEPSSFTAAQCTKLLCPNTIPGNKFLQWLDGGLSNRIYGCPEVGPPGGTTNGCVPNPLTAASCKAHPNYWSTQNLMSAVEMSKTDPRLLVVMVTDPGTLANGNKETPVRHYAAFYVTGWTGDPCSGVAISGQNEEGLFYTSVDKAPTDSAGDFFLVGHFIKYFQPSATGSGNTCTLNSIDNCTLVLTK